MKKGLVLFLVLLVLTACGQQKKDEPDKEVSGQMGEKTVVLTVDPVQKGSSVQFHMSLKMNQIEILNSRLTQVKNSN